VWKQAQFAYRLAGLADSVLSDSDSCFVAVGSGLLDIRTVAGSDADPTYSAKMMKCKDYYRHVPNYVRVLFLIHF